jgi:hypothetical protein
VSNEVHTPRYSVSITSELIHNGYHQKKTHRYPTTSIPPIEQTVHTDRPEVYRRIKILI